MTVDKEQGIKVRSLLRSLKIALVYAVLFLCLAFWFKDSLSTFVSRFVNSSELWLNPKMMLGVFMSFLVCHLINAVSWMVLLQPPKERRFVVHLKGATVYSALINLLPIGTGHLLGLWFFNKFSGIRVKRLLMGWTIDQYMRGLIKVLALFIFIQWVEPFGEIGKRLEQALNYFAWLIVGGALAFPFVKKSKKVMELWDRFWLKLGQEQKGEGEESIYRLFVYAFGLRASCWVFEIFPVYLLCYCLLGEANIELIAVLFLSVKVATAYSISPGNFGVHEAVAYFICTSYGVSDELALSIGILYHLGFWLPTVLPGFFVLIKEVVLYLKSRKELKPNPL